MQIKNTKDISDLNLWFRFPEFDEQIALVNKGLATRKISKCGNYSLFKYTRKVMYDALWFTNVHLMECRGHVYDNRTGEIVTYAPRKSFNYGEFGWWSEINPNDEVFFAKKWNGFLINQNKDNMLTTTGSFDSDFVDYAAESIVVCDKLIGGDLTSSQEVIHDLDPHIVQEVSGNGCNIRIPLTNRYEDGRVEPYDLQSAKLKDVIDFATKSHYEGYMVYHVTDDFKLAPVKLKTDYYVAKKRLMRLSKDRVKKMYNGHTVFGNFDLYADENRNLWNEISVAITKKFQIEYWMSIDDQTRRKYIEELYLENS